MPRISSRIYAEGKWIAESPIHCGGENDEFEAAPDMVIVRDSEGEPRIPAASVAGAGRSWLARATHSRERFRKGEETPSIHALFGDKYASLLSVCDAPCLTPTIASGIRDGVRIDGATVSRSIPPAITSRFFRSAPHSGSASGSTSMTNSRVTNSAANSRMRNCAKPSAFCSMALQPEKSASVRKLARVSEKAVSPPGISVSLKRQTPPTSTPGSTAGSTTVSR